MSSTAKRFQQFINIDPFPVWTERTSPPVFFFLIHGKTKFNIVAIAQDRADTVDVLSLIHIWMNICVKQGDSYLWYESPCLMIFASFSKKAGIFLSFSWRMYFRQSSVFLANRLRELVCGIATNFDLDPLDSTSCHKLLFSWIWA